MALPTIPRQLHTTMRRVSNLVPMNCAHCTRASTPLGLIKLSTSIIVHTQSTRHHMQQAMASLCTQRAITQIRNPNRTQPLWCFLENPLARKEEERPLEELANRSVLAKVELAYLWCGKRGHGHNARVYLWQKEFTPTMFITIIHGHTCKYQRRHLHSFADAVPLPFSIWTQTLHHESHSSYMIWHLQPPVLR